MKTLRIGVTGLSRAGKTAFLTSLIHHLVDVPAVQIPEWHNKLIHDAIPINDGLYAKREGVFHLGKHLSDLRLLRPQWPVPTREETFYRIELKLQSIADDGQKKATSNVRLEFYDYPGEMLHDVPLVGQSYERWSEETLLRIETELGQKRDELPEDVREAFDAWQNVLEAGLGNSEKFLVKSYRKLCLALMESKLPFFAPVHPVLAQDDSSWQFCPLPAFLGEKNNPTRDHLRKNYYEYVTKIVHPLRKRLTGCHKHVVLVDLFDILRNSHSRHRRVQADLRAVLKGFDQVGLRRYAKLRDRLPPMLRDRLPRWLHERRRPDVIFGATKADHARADTRDNLRKLLKALVQKSADGLELQGFHPQYVFCSAIRSTTDGKTEENGQIIKILKGTKIKIQNGKGQDSPDDHKLKWWLPEEISDIPAEWPRAEWPLFQFVDFAPIRVPKIDTLSIPNINLIDVLNKILVDYL